MGLRHAALIVGLSLTLCHPASAGLLHFDLQDDGIEFNLPSMPTPLSYDDSSFEVRATSGTQVGGQQVPFFDLTFRTDGAGGGFFNFYYPGSPLADIVEGPQLFSETVEHPIFAVGKFDVIGIVGEPTSLIITSVPLPASAPMFGAALIALGVAGYVAKCKKAAAAL